MFHRGISVKIWTLLFFLFETNLFFELGVHLEKAVTSWKFVSASLIVEFEDLMEVQAQKASS